MDATPTLGECESNRLLLLVLSAPAHIEVGFKPQPRLVLGSQPVTWWGLQFLSPINPDWRGIQLNHTRMLP